MGGMRHMKRVMEAEAWPSTLLCYGLEQRISAEPRHE
jgi:hypothetical protein